MSRTALRRAVGLSITSIVISVALGYLHVAGTFALWDAGTSNANSAFEAGWIGPPTALGTPAPSGYGASLSWTPGTHGPVTGQKLYGVSGGAGASASCGTYALAATMSSATLATYTDPNSSTNNGKWWCYRMVSTSATAWTASADFTPIRVGLIPTAVAITNGNGSLDSGDTIKITFNQNVNNAASAAVCTFQGAGGTGVILIGDSTCSSATGDAYTVGKLTGVTVGGSAGSNQKRNTTISTVGAVVTVTVGQNGQTVSGTATFTASTSITSSAGSAQACTASNCLVVATGGF